MLEESQLSPLFNNYKSEISNDYINQGNRIFKKYYENGQIYKEEKYKNHILYNNKRYYENGNLEFEYNYDKNKILMYKYYSSNGILHIEYISNKITKKYTHYYCDECNRYKYKDINAPKEYNDEGVCKCFDIIKFIFHKCDCSNLENFNLYCEKKDVVKYYIFNYKVSKRVYNFFTFFKK